MKCDQQKLVRQRDAETAHYFCARPQLDGAGVVKAKRAHDVNAPVLFPKLTNSLAVRSSGGKMEMGHLGERMAPDVVKCAFGNLATMDVRQGNPKRDRRQGCGVHFKTISENY